MNDHFLKERYKYKSNLHLQGKINEYTWFGGTDQEAAECGLMKAELLRREQENEQG